MTNIFLGTFYGFSLSVEVNDDTSQEIRAMLIAEFVTMARKSSYTEIDPVLAELCGMKTKTILDDFT